MRHTGSPFLLHVQTEVRTGEYHRVSLDVLVVCGRCWRRSWAVYDLQRAAVWAWLFRSQGFRTCVYLRGALRAGDRAGNSPGSPRTAGRASGQP